MIEVQIRIWDQDEVARWAGRLEAIATVHNGAVGFRRWAAELARSLRAAGAALDFVDEDDGDAVFDVLTRLDLLRKDAEHLLSRASSTAGEEITVVRSVTSTDDATTVVMALPSRVR